MSRWHELPLQLLAVTILPLTALLLLIAFGGLTLHQRAMRELVAERDQRAVRAAAAALTEQLNHRAAAVRGLALRTSDAPAPNGVLADSEFLLPDFEGGLALFAANTSASLSAGGDLLAASEEWTHWHTWPATAQLVRAARTDDKARFSDSISDLRYDGPIMLAAAAAPDGTVAVGAFYPASLARAALAEAFLSNKQAAAFLVDETGQLLYRTGAPLQFAPDLTQHPGVVNALRGESGANYVSATDGEHVVAFSPVSAVGWALVIEEPWTAVSNPWLRTTQAAPLVLIPALLFAIVALWFGARQIVRPLRALAGQATELSWGRYEALEEPVGGIGEIRRLQAELAHMARKVQAAQRSLHGYVGAITAGQEEERRRLARELHDDTIQSLIALDQRVQLAQLALDSHSFDGAQDRPASQSLAEVHAIAAQTIEDVRRFTRALRPVYLEDLGLVPALNALARDTQEVLGIPVGFHISGSEVRLAPEVELALYRIAQEALSNVARHAQAGHSSLQLAFDPEAVLLTVEDDGQGFGVPDSPAEFAPRGHFGLLGMHERAELIGARLEIRSAPGEGARLVITAPASSVS